MGDLISRKAAIKALRAEYKDCIADPGEGQLIAIGLESAVDIVRDIQAEDAASKRKLFRFCPNCGAKMDKETNDGT